MQYLLEGELDNTQPGRVTGWLRFDGLPQIVRLDLAGDFLADIRGAKVALRGQRHGSRPEARKYMDGFALRQTGWVGNMTAGGPSGEWTDYPYFEWYSNTNERVVLDPEPHQICLVATSAPVDLVASDSHAS